jgi:hypothetical protein
MFNIPTKIAAACAALITAAGVGVALASPAAADTGSVINNTFYPYGTKGDQNVSEYLQELRDSGGKYDDPSSAWRNADQLGAHICSSLNAGYSEDQLLNYVVVNAANANRDEAKVVVWGAEWHFCPSYYRFS